MDLDGDFMAFIYQNSAWATYDSKKYEVTTTTFTTYPFMINSPTTPISATIYGNMQQIGIPTPTTPIQPLECGDLETTGEHTGQYKIPILSGNSTTSVYLGEIQTKRKIKKIVITGNEQLIYRNPSIYQSNAFFITRSDYLNNTLIGFCTHYPTVSQTTAVEGIYFGTNISIFTKFSDGLDTVEKIKEYFATQYANGTPVTIWYILATSTTGILNEPIRKLGEYVDTVTTSIPVTINSDSVDINTTLKPSAVSAPLLSWGTGDDYKRSSGAWD